MRTETEDCGCVKEFFDHNWKMESFTRTTRCEGHGKKHQEYELAEKKRREDEDKRRKDKYDQLIQSLKNVQDTKCVKVSEVMPNQKDRDDLVKNKRKLHSVMNVRKEKNRWWVNAECLKIYKKISGRGRKNI